MRILSIDLGDKRVGLAISDPLGFSAQGLDTFERAKSSKDDFDHLKKICVERKVTKCVVGLPLRLTGEAGPKAKQVLEWVDKLKTVLPCPVETWDERFTSKEAERLVITQGLTREKRKEKSDQLAAILILQSYLENRRNTSQSESGE